MTPTMTPFAEIIYGLPAALADVAFPLPLPNVDAAQRTKTELRTQLHDYLLPRLASMDAPILAVVGGSTGAGKSTLVNGLIGKVVTRPGVLRPTTKAPVIVYHPANEMWFDSDRVLPGLARTRSASSDQRSLQLVAETSLPTGLAILDAPDIDSIDDDNRSLAATLLNAADLWLFVTSAARYADAVPWEFLTKAALRGTCVAVVCDRIPPEAIEDVPRHLGQMMSERGLGDSLLFALPETDLDYLGMLPDAAVEPIRTWLAGLASNIDQRRDVIGQTLTGALRSLAPRLDVLAAAADDQLEAIRALEADASAAFAEAVRQVNIRSADGTLLRGEVLTRWHDFVGTGEFMRVVDKKVSWLKDRILGAVRGGVPESESVSIAVGAGLEALATECGSNAWEQAHRAWRATPAGRFVLEHAPHLASPSPEFGAGVARAIRDWQADVFELVSEQGQSRKAKARMMALGVNGVGAALIIAIFASTGGLTGAEVGVAGGTSLLAQRLLEAVFGDGAIRKLSEHAKDMLNERVEGVYAIELARFQDALGTLDVSEDGGTPIRVLMERLESSLEQQTREDAKS